MRLLVTQRHPSAPVRRIVMMRPGMRVVMIVAATAPRLAKRNQGC